MSPPNVTRPEAEPVRPGRIRWRPPPDDELTWFRPGGVLPDRPSPLAATLTVPAMTFGLTHALISLYFPLSEVRSRLVDGQLYLALVPSPMAERDPRAQLRRMQDSARRFSRDIRGAWARQGREEVVGYNKRMAAFPAADATNLDVAAQLPDLRRMRGNQWFISVRLGIATPAMLRALGSPFSVEDAAAVVGEIRDLVVARGAAELEGAMRRVADRLVAAGSIEAPADVDLLELDEIAAALADGTDRRSVVEARRAWLARPRAAEPPEQLGPPFPPDGLGMRLLREVLAIISGADLN